MEPTNEKRAAMKRMGRTWVKAHTRDGHTVRGHWRIVPAWAWYRRNQRGEGFSQAA